MSIQDGMDGLQSYKQFRIVGTAQAEPTILTLEECAEEYAQHIHKLCTTAYERLNTSRRAFNILDYPAVLVPNMPENARGTERTLKEEMSIYTYDTIQEVSQQYQLSNRRGVSGKLLQGGLLENRIHEYARQYEKTEISREQLNRNWYKTLPLLLLGGAIAGFGLIWEADIHLRYFQLIKEQPSTIIEASIICGILGAAMTGQTYITRAIHEQTNIVRSQEEKLEEQLRGIKWGFKSLFEQKKEADS